MIPECFPINNKYRIDNRQGPSNIDNLLGDVHAFRGQWSVTYTGGCSLISPLDVRQAIDTHAHASMLPYVSEKWNSTYQPICRYGVGVPATIITTQCSVIWKLDYLFKSLQRKKSKLRITGPFFLWGWGATIVTDVFLSQSRPLMRKDFPCLDVIMA